MPATWAYIHYQGLNTNPPDPLPAPPPDVSSVCAAQGPSRFASGILRA